MALRAMFLFEMQICRDSERKARSEPLRASPCPVLLSKRSAQAVGARGRSRPERGGSEADSHRMEGSGR